jgi:hypothetical protein
MQAGAAEALLQALSCAVGAEAAATAMVATALEALYQLVGDDGAWRRLLRVRCVPTLQALLGAPHSESVRQRAAAVLSRLLRHHRAADDEMVVQVAASSFPPSLLPHLVFGRPLDAAVSDHPHGAIVRGCQEPCWQ